MPRGFVLQPTYRLESGRPVVHLFGRLEDGSPFLIRDRRGVPHFWIRAMDADRARSIGVRRLAPEPGRHTTDGAAVVRIEVRAPGDAPPLRERLTAAGVTSYEADVRFAYRYLMERELRSSVDIEGAAVTRPDGLVVFDDPEVRPGSWTPSLSVLSLDIETDPNAQQVLSIALVGAGLNDVLLFTPLGFDCPPTADGFAEERLMLQSFVDRVRASDPDVLTGWNVVDFDLAVLERRCRELDVRLDLGRTDEPLRLRDARSPRARREAQIPGRLVMDGLQLVRGAFVRLEDYSLGGASQALLGRGKLITGAHRGDQILRAFREDRPHLVAYNRTDAQLVLDILDKLDLIELSVARSALTGMPPDRVDASIASFDFLYLSELGRRRLVAPSVRDVPGLETQGGGFVLDPEAGLHDNVLILDFKSLYPSIIRTFNIDPVGLAQPGALDDDDDIVAPNGARFGRAPGILPALLDDLMPQRERAKTSGNAIASYAIKILMNSFYGVLGTSVCRFASPALVNAITGYGRTILLWCRDRLEQRGYRVLYGDTDSLFVHAGTLDPAEADAIGRTLAVTLNDELAAHLASTWRVTSRLELEFEKRYRRMVLPAMRGGGGGARKRYVGLIADPDDPTARGSIEFVGMEAVRRDWTDLAREIQRELYERLFADQPVADFVHEVVAHVRAGRRDDELVYRKALRRKLESYTTTTPPHVAAARKMRGRPGRVIAYVMTSDGPESVAERTAAPLDREHYVQKQVRPVAEPVLELLDLEFDRVIGDDRQMRLF